MSNLWIRDILFISINGGTGDLFWGYIVVFVGVALTYASLAEMASMYAHGSSTRYLLSVDHS